MSDFLDRIKGIFNSRISSPFRSMSLLVVGEVLGKGVAFLALPLITRIYSPEDMGVLALYNSLVMMLAPFGSLKYSNAIVLPKSNEMAINLSVFGFVFNAFLFIFFGIVFYFFKDSYLKIFFEESILTYWFYICVSVFLINIYDILYYWALRSNKYNLISKTKPIQSISGEVAKIGFGLIEIRPTGLLIGSILNRSGGIITLSRLYIKDLNKYFKSISYQRIKFLLSFYKDFPLYKLSSYFIFVVSSNSALPIIIAYLYGDFINGQIGLSLAVLGVPISLVGTSISQVFYNEISKFTNKESDKLYKFTLDIAKKLLLFSVPPFIILFFFAEDIFRLLFGSEWEMAGAFSSLLSIYLLTQFIASPLMSIFVVLKKQHKTLFIHGFRLIGIIIISALAYYLKFSIYTYLLVYSLFISIHYSIVVFKLFRLIKTSKT